jgi:hypothetical protein
VGMVRILPIRSIRQNVLGFLRLPEMPKAPKIAEIETRRQEN